MNRRFKVFIAVALVMVMAMSQMALAKTNNGIGWGQQTEQAKADREHGRDSAPGYHKILERFTVIDGNRIKVNKRNVNFDAPPMIIDGRTLIPVRAIVEILDGLVFWDADEFMASIISPDGDVMIEFYLDEDNYGGQVWVYRYEDGGLEDPADELWVFDGKVDLDVLPGIHQNRTYVPLRFIAEIFSLGVHYDPWTGAIDILDGPRILADPDNRKFEFDVDDSDVDPLVVYIDENESGFEGIHGLDYSPEFGEEDYTTRAALDLELKDIPDYATGATLVLYLDESVLDDKGLYNFVLRFTGGLQDIFRKLTIRIGE